MDPEVLMEVFVRNWLWREMFSGQSRQKVGTIPFLREELLEKQQ